MYLDDSVKVTMLGVERTGKTCYLLAMYGVMSLGKGLDGFTIAVPKESDLKELTEDWDTLIDPDPESNQPRWPLPTPGEPRTYNFNLCFALNNRIINFDWFEYRGGALVEFPSTANSEDVQALSDRIQITSSILICVSGEHLTTTPNFVDCKKIGVDRINQIIGGAMKNGENIPPAVVIVITKFDLCKHRSWNDIVSDIKDMFSPFFSEEAKWLVLICPVSLGLDLKENSESGGMEGDINPINVHHPIFFSLYAELLRKYWQLNTSLERNIQAYESLEDDILQQIFQRKAVSRSEEDITQIEYERDQVKNSLELILRKIDTDDLNQNSRLFFDGKEVEFKDIAG